MADGEIDQVLTQLRHDHVPKSDEKKTSLMVDEHLKHEYEKVKDTLPQRQEASEAELKYKECLEQNCVKARTTVYVAFGKECVPGTDMHNQYSKLRSHDEKNNFRVEWAKNKYEKMESGRRWNKK